MIRKLRPFPGLLLAVSLLALAAPATALPPPWMPLGPFGGQVYSLTADPVHPGTVYALTFQGIYKTVNGGASWSLVYLGTPQSNLAIDPSHPSTLYVGVTGPILIKSTDGGAHWTPSASGLIPDPVFVPRILAIDPKNPRRLLLSYGQGLWRSVDAGASWQPADTGLPAGANTPVDAVAIASGAAFVVTPGGVYRSLDGGASWSPAGGGLPTAPSGALAVAPSDPRTVYASLPGEGLYQSRNSGASWRQVSGPENAYTLALTVSPRSPRTLYASSGHSLVRSTDGGAHWTPLPGSPGASALAFDAGSQTTLYAGGWRSILGGVLRSDDGGLTWKPRRQGMTGIAVTALAVDPASPNRLWAGANVLFRSENRGARWVRTAFPPNLVSELAVGASSQVFALAGFSPPLLWTSRDLGASWTVSLGDPDSLAVRRFQVAPSDLGTLYAAVVNRQNNQALYRSTDSGATWQVRSAEPALPGCGIRDLAVAPSARQIVYFSTFMSPPSCPVPVFRSTDGGATWTGGAAGIPVVTPSVLAVDPHDPDVVYLGTGDASNPGDGVWKSTDGGQSWTQTGHEIATRTITALLASTLSGRVYAATRDGRVFRSDDGGATWQGWSRGLRTTRIDSLVADPGDPRRIYAATANGVWTLNEGD